LENLPDDKILARLKDWNCEWLARPNIAISEMASTLKDNMETILAYRGTVFTEDFVDQLQGFMTPMMGPLQRLDNKDRSTNDPPTQDDVLDVLEGINGNNEVEQLFVDGYNACGPVLMMAIHVMAINILLHNPPEFANQTLRCTATEEFKANPSDENMMRFLLDSILMRAAPFNARAPCGIGLAINGTEMRRPQRDHHEAPKGLITTATQEDSAAR